MNERILIIDDDADVQDLTRSCLEREGYVVYAAAEGGVGLELVSARAPALIVLDLGLPDMSGEAVLGEVRRRSQIPVLVLSAKAGSDARALGLTLGADDYMDKPFSVREFVARVKALLRRAAGDAIERDLLTFDGGRLQIDRVRHEVTVDGEPRPVTPSEFNLLLALAHYPGRVYTRGEIAYRMRGYEFEGDDGMVVVHVRNLRVKIEADPANPRFVETVRGIGYRLGVEPS